MACLRLVTFLPLRPDLSLPRFISCISVSTFFPAEGEYLRPEDFLRLELFFALLERPRVLDVRLEDFFVARRVDLWPEDDLVAIVVPPSTVR